MASTKPQSSEVIDVAIVGGGVAGAYSAYRLMNVEPDRNTLLGDFLQRSGRDRLDVRLFETSDRIGGRLWSYHFPDMPDLPVDIGGMGFSQLQQNVYGLCTKELNLTTSPCKFFNTPLLQYVRKRRFNNSDYSKPDLVPYNLDPGERGNDPGTITLNALVKAVKGSEELIGNIIKEIQSGDLSTALTLIGQLTTLLRTTPINDGFSSAGKYLHQVGYWNLLADAFSIEAYHLCDDSSFAPSYNRNWNLYDSFMAFINVLCCFMLTGDCCPFTKLDNGYDELPKTLVAGFQEKGGKVQMETQLYGLKRAVIDGEQIVEMIIGPPGASDNARSSIYARSVVLAMPKRALELLDSDSSIFESRQFKEDMDAVTPMAGSKTFMAYDRAWWNDSGIQQGYSATDLPIKVIYYIGAQSDGKALLLAGLNDGRFVQFWDGYLEATRQPSFNAWFTGSGDGVPESMKAPHDMIVETQRQLEQVHGYDIPDPTHALFFNWTQDPFGGGWHNWNPHVKSWEIMPRIRKPLDDANIFLCGEAYSAVQGWVEGALNTAEMVLEQHFGLPRPTWVLPEYDFGP